MKTKQEKTFAVGKYLVSPLTKLTDAGTYAASVSIRSGNGPATHDRVFRFDARFPTPEGAHRFALDHGMAWLQSTSPTSTRSSIGQGRTD